MTIDFIKTFKFNLDTNRVVEVPIPDEATDFSDYIEELIKDVIGDLRSKKYLFPEEATTTMTGIQEILNINTRELAAKGFARRLMTEEIRVQGRIEHLNKEVQKGIMIQTVVTAPTQKYFLIIKAEHYDFIDEGSRRKATGLPIKKKIFKAFCAYLDEQNQPSHAMVSDYRTVMSTYWWENFLELKEEYTNEYNTEKSFDALERKIFNPIKEQHPRDYMCLRNATVLYYRSREEFILEDYLQEIISPYEPEDATLDMVRIADRIRQLPERSQFNGRFSVIREKLKKRIIKRLPLTPQLELVIKEAINWDNSVQAIEENGLKYIRIRTDTGFKYFKES